MQKAHIPAIVVACVLLLSSQGANARKWTITQRQASLRSEIDKAFRANQLTLKESQSLKSEATKITEHEQKMKDKNAGKLSYKDDTKLEKELNDLSNKIHKLILEKRVQ